MALQFKITIHHKPALLANVLESLHGFKVNRLVKTTQQTSNDGNDALQASIKLNHLYFTVTDEMATQRILVGSTAEVECKLGPTPFNIVSMSLIIGDNKVGVNNAPSAVKGTVAPGTIY